MANAPKKKRSRPAGSAAGRKTAARQAPRYGVRIRMYRLGVGDCFLLRFARATGKEFSMLIDCGVHQARKGGGERIKQVVADLHAETGGHLDLIVATHEHWDHLSGFSQAKDQFAKFTVDQIWVAWTEDARDRDAQRLISLRHRAISAVGRATLHLHLAGKMAAAEDLSGLLGFFGDTSGTKLKGAGAALKALVKSRDAIRYREPGEKPIEIEGANARIFVLGPPRDEAALKRSQPTKRGDEVYVFGAYGAELAAIEPALGDAPAGPFDRRHALPLESTRGDAFFQRHYWHDELNSVPAQDGPSAAGSIAHGHEAWRRIDEDWMDAAAGLALKLDEDTNNTSLVLAIELGRPESADNPVLLFAADAQVGNCQSWQSVAWKDFHGREVTGPDLLRRTIVYKVSHHASHNATLKGAGLELMDALRIALIPTDKEMAETVGWGTLPWKDLLDRLAERAKDGVIRTDIDDARVSGAFTVEDNELYYELSLTMS